MRFRPWLSVIQRCLKGKDVCSADEVADSVGTEGGVLESGPTFEIQAGTHTSPPPSPYPTTSNPTDARTI